MPKKILLIIISLVILCCKEEDNAKFVTISGVTNKISQDTLYLKTHERLYLNSQEKIEYQIVLDSDNTFNEVLTIEKGYYELLFDDKTIPLFLNKGFNLNINISDSEIQISGIGEVENQYLQRKRDLNDNLAPINYYHYFSYLDESDFLKLADSIKDLRDNLINSYALPNKEFKFLEESYSKIDKAHKLIKYPFTRLLNDTNYVQSKQYPYYFKDINLNDERLIEIPLFNMLLFSDVLLKSEAINNTSQDKSLNELRIAISDNEQITNEIVKEQLVFTLANFTIEYTDSLDLFYKTYLNNAKDNNNIKVISSKYFGLKGYAKGMKLPDFEFYDNKGELVTFESLKGSLLFIDIWATWCKPCIKEMTPSNELQEKLLPQNIKFINICIESKKDSWLEVINENNFGGIHLFCSKKNESIFKDNYLVESLPRYLIVDEEGRIIDFNAKKPSNKKLEIELIDILKSTYGNNVYN